MPIQTKIAEKGQKTEKHKGFKVKTSKNIWFGGLQRVYVTSSLHVTHLIPIVRHIYKIASCEYVYNFGDNFSKKWKKFTSGKLKQLKAYIDNSGFSVEKIATAIMVQVMVYTLIFTVIN